MPNTSITFAFDAYSMGFLTSHVERRAHSATLATDLLVMFHLGIVLGLDVDLLIAVFTACWYPVARWFVIPRMYRYYGRRYVQAITFDPGDGVLRFDRLHGDPVHATALEVSYSIVRYEQRYRQPIHHMKFHVSGFDDLVVRPSVDLDRKALAEFLHVLENHGVRMRGVTGTNAIF